MLLLSALLIALTSFICTTTIFAEETYTVYIEPSDGGGILFVSDNGEMIGPGPIAFAAGSTVHICVQPLPTAKLDTVYMDGDPVSNTSEYTFIMPEHDVTITCTFIVNTMPCTPECPHDQLTHIERKMPTCEGPGVEEYWVCDRCGEMYADAEGKISIHEETLIDPLGHDWSDWKIIKDATDTEPGMEERTCHRDTAHVEKREIPAKDKGIVQPIADIIEPIIVENEGIVGTPDPPQKVQERFRVTNTSAKGA